MDKPEVYFQKTVDNRAYRTWLEIVQLASTISFSDEDDTLIWKFTSNGVCTSQSLYKIINFRGVIPVHVLNVWSIKIPPRVQFFLWLLANNRVLTRDNLAKRQEVTNKRCFLCDEKESSQHLFFDCVVAKNMRKGIYDIVGRDMGNSFDSGGVCWPSEKKYVNINIISPAALWGLWKLRNELCFQDGAWISMKHLWWKEAGLVQNWLILCPSKELNSFSLNLRAMARSPEAITG
jgi:hypothetical protein